MRHTHTRVFCTHVTLQRFFIKILKDQQRSQNIGHTIWVVVHRLSYVESNLTTIFGICMTYSPSVPVFITFRQGVHEHRQSCMDHSKNEILWDTRWPDMKTSIDFPCLMALVPCIIINFWRSPDELNAKPDDFFWITHSQEARVHLGVNKFWFNVCLSFFVCVYFKIGKLGYKSVRIIRVLAVISI